MSDLKDLKALIDDIKVYDNDRALAETLIDAAIEISHKNPGLARRLVWGIRYIAMEKLYDMYWKFVYHKAFDIEMSDV